MAAKAEIISSSALKGLSVPDRPESPFIEGDGTSPETLKGETDG
jgi:isocitrate dehydrogenase